MFNFDDESLLDQANMRCRPPHRCWHGRWRCPAAFAGSAALATNALPDTPRMLRPFLPWQSAAFAHVELILNRWQGALLGDDMGLGKTQVLLALANDAIQAHGSYAIVVVPTVAEAGYRADLRASFPGLRLHVVKGRTVRDLPAADIYMISDDSLTMKAWLTDEYTDSKGRRHHAGERLGPGAHRPPRRDSPRQGQPGQANGPRQGDARSR